MAQIDTAQALSRFVGSLPTFIAVILAWMNSSSRASDLNNRMGDLNNRLNDLQAEMNTRFADTKARITETRDLLRSDFRQVWHQEERE